MHSPLCTDFYQLTMAYGYFKEGIAEEEACFQVTFRKHPFKGEFTIAAGLETVAQYILNYRFKEDELAYLGSLHDANNRAYFSRDFLDYLRNLQLSIDVEAMPEGTAVFPSEPLIRIRGPILQCQLLETPLLNIINFQSLIATKAARICLAAGTCSVIDFGLRRAQGFDGALSASRAAFIGGCESTSNVLAGFRFGIPVSGTLAHSFIMRFAEEKDAFRAFSRAMPSNSILLTDTYGSLSGIKNAIEIGRWLRSQGYDLRGVRLDSGDLVALSKQARAMLDEAGFNNSIIIASNELDEHGIAQLKKSAAPIDAFGVGTRLVTAFDEPALGGVYKLAAVKQGNVWRYRIKLSDDHAKTTMPGILQVRRFEDDHKFIKDIIFDEEIGIENPAGIGGTSSDLLQPVFVAGRLNYQFPLLAEVQERSRHQLKKLPEHVLSLEQPSAYPVSFDAALVNRRQNMINEVKQK